MKTVKLSDVGYEILKELAKKNKMKPDEFNEHYLHILYRNQK